MIDKIITAAFTFIFLFCIGAACISLFSCDLLAFVRWLVGVIACAFILEEV